MLVRHRARCALIPAGALACLLSATAAIAQISPPPPPAGGDVMATPGAPSNAGDGRARPPMLRGPHPFRHENTLSATGGYGVGNQFHGVRAALGYGYELAGSLWLDLRLDLLDGAGAPPVRDVPVCTDCGKVETFAAVGGGLAYRLRADIPVIPYAAVTAGPIFLFNRGARGAVGVALRAGVGARYYLYHWLGLGLEVGGLWGAAVVDTAAGLSANVAVLDLGLSGEVQF